MNVLIAAVLLALLALLFYVGRMLFLAAGAPGGNFDAPSEPTDLSALADTTSSSDHSHDPDSFDSSEHDGH